LGTIILIYVIFAIATSLASLYVILSPVLNSISKYKPDNLLLENKFLTYLVFAIMFFFAAPVLFFIYMIADYTESFKIGLENSLSEV
jgi:hypothetical protein